MFTFTPIADSVEDYVRIIMLNNNFFKNKNWNFFVPQIMSRAQFDTYVNISTVLSTSFSKTSTIILVFSMNVSKKLSRMEKWKAGVNILRRSCHLSPEENFNRKFFNLITPLAGYFSRTTERKNSKKISEHSPLDPPTYHRTSSQIHNSAFSMRKH